MMYRMVAGVTVLSVGCSLYASDMPHLPDQVSEGYVLIESGNNTGTTLTISTVHYVTAINADLPRYLRLPYAGNMNIPVRTLDTGNGQKG
jgi:hypothetical protein